MLAVPRGDVASSFAAHCAHLCSRSCAENAFCKPKFSKCVQMEEQQTAGLSFGSMGFLGLTTCPLPAIFITLPPLTPQQAPAALLGVQLTLRAIRGNGVLSVWCCVNTVIVVVGPECSRASPGSSLHFGGVITWLACFMGSLVAAVWQQLLLLTV